MTTETRYAIDPADLARRYERELHRPSPENIVEGFRNRAREHGDIAAISQLLDIIERRCFAAMVRAFGDAHAAAEADLARRAESIERREQRLRDIAAR